MYDCTLAKRIVVKVGTSTLTHENGKANLRRMEAGERPAHIVNGL